MKFDYIDALNNITKGLKVCRNAWNIGDYIYMDKNDKRIVKKFISEENISKNYIGCSEDIDAKDWMLYKE